MMPSVSETPPVVGVVMGSKSDWETLKHADQVLTEFGVPHECRIVSAHRTPNEMADYAREAEGRGLKVIIAGAGGAAHLPGMIASQTTLPVLGVPVESHALKGLDSLLSIVHARRSARGDAGHRQGGRDQRSAPGDRHPRDVGPQPPDQARDLPG